MKFATKILCWVLSVQIAAGPALAQVSSIGGAANRTRVSVNVGASQIITRGATENYTTLDRYPQDLTKEELAIDTMAEADEYVKSTMDQAQWFEEQCAVSKPDGVYMKWDTAFVLHDNIPYSDMDIKNCAQEHEKLTHMLAVAKTLTEHYGTEDQLVNKNCADCSVSKVLDDNDTNPDFIPPGDKCSRAVQAKVAAEGCGALNALGKAVTQWSCLGNLLKGVLLGLKDAIVGIGKLLWEGVKWAGKQIKKGVNNFLVWTGFKKAETKADENILAVSKKKQEEYDAYNKDKEGWLKRTGDTILNIIKEIAYVGMYERESKCMTCKEKGDLLCEIGGRIFNDVVGFTFTLGVGYGAIATMTKKLAPKLTEITAKMTARYAAAAERGGLAAKTRNAIWRGTKATGKSVKWVGNLPIKFVGYLSKKTMALWKKFKDSKAWTVLVNPKNPNKSVAGLFRKAANTVPGKIIVNPVKWTGKQIGRYFRWDQRIFAKGAYTGARFGWATKAEAIALKQSMLPKLDKDEVVMENSATLQPTFRFESKPGADNAFKGQLVEQIDPSEYEIVAKLEKRNGKTVRVWEVPPAYLEQNAEKLAELKRAKIELPALDANGRYVKNERGMIELQTPNDNFKKLYRGQYETKTYKKTDIPMDKDGVVVIRYDNQIEYRKAKEITKKEMAFYNEKRANFTTKDHPNYRDPINPNKIDAKWVSRNREDPGKVVSVYKGQVFVYEAKDITPKFIAEAEAKGHRFIEEGTDNAQAISKWTKDNKIADGQEILETQAKKNFDLGAAGKPEEKTAAQLTGVENLEVSLPPAVEEATQAQTKLARQYSGHGKITPNTLKGMEEAYPVEHFVRNIRQEDPHLQLNFLNGETKKLPYVHEPGNGVASVHVYQNETKAVVRKANGETILYDLSKGDEGVRISAINKSDIKQVQTAMGELRNGKLPKDAAIDDVIENMKSQGRVEGKDFVIVEEKGKTSLRIKLDEACNPPKFIDIPFAL